MGSGEKAGETGSPGEEVIDPDIEKLLKEHGTVVMGVLVFLILSAPTGPKRPDVPGLYERRNSAWRGRGSFGKAPFGSQVSHRRR
jgi:hypothetical protein